MFRKIDLIILTTSANISIITNVEDIAGSVESPGFGARRGTKLRENNL